MVAVIVRHKVQSFDAWKPVFEEHGEVRRRYGGTGHQIYRVNGDPNDLVIVCRFKDEEGARGFTRDSSLHEVIEKAGVINAPEVTLTDVAEDTEYELPVA
jgi:hypothetical protein